MDELPVNLLFRAAQAHALEKVRRDRKRSSEAVARLLDVIAEKAFAQEFNVNHLLRSCGANWRIRKRFEAELGVGIKDYLKQLQKIAVAWLLVKTDLEIGRIAKGMGYGPESTPNLSRDFRILTGESPSDYRNARRHAGSGWVARVVEDAARRYPEPVVLPADSYVYLGGDDDRANADIVWTVLREEPPERQIELLRCHIFFARPALFERISRASLEAGRQRCEDGVRIGEVALAAVEGSRPLLGPAYGNLRPLAMARLANALRLTGDVTAAAELFDCAEEEWNLPRKATDKRIETEMLRLKGTLRFAQGRTDDARKLLGDSLDLAREVGDLELQAKARVQRANVAACVGRPEDMILDLRAAAALLGHRPQTGRLVMAVYLNLVWAYTELGEIQLAEDLLSSASELNEEMNDALLHCQLQWIEGLLVKARGQWRRAESSFRLVGMALHRLGDCYSVAMLAFERAIICQEQGRHAEALLVLASDLMPVLNEALERRPNQPELLRLRAAIESGEVPPAYLLDARPALIHYTFTLSGARKGGAEGNPAPVEPVAVTSALEMRNSASVPGPIRLDRPTGPTAFPAPARPDRPTGPSALAAARTGQTMGRTGKAAPAQTGQNTARSGQPPEGRPTADMRSGSAAASYHRSEDRVTVSRSFSWVPPCGGAEGDASMAPPARPPVQATAEGAKTKDDRHEGPPGEVAGTLSDRQEPAGSLEMGDRVFALAARAGLARIAADRQLASPEVGPLLDRIANHLFDAGFGLPDLVPSSGADAEERLAAFVFELGSPASYIGDIRLATAMILLVQTDWAVSRIAWAVGYLEPSTFSHLCKRRFEMSPTEYRHLARQKATESLLAEAPPARPAPAKLLRCCAGVASPLPEAVRARIARSLAERHWASLAGLSPDHRLSVVQTTLLFGRPELFEILSTASRNAGRHDRQLAVRIGELALASVEGSQPLLGPRYANLRCLALARLSNAHRLGGNLDMAARLSDRSDEAWQTPGAGQDRRIEAEITALRGSLRLFQRCFGEARALLDRAVDLASELGWGAMELDVRLQRAAVAGYEGRPAAAIPDLQAALGLAGDAEETDPRILLGIHQDLALASLETGAADAARPELARARVIWEELGTEVGGFQLPWIEGLLARAAGQPLKAERLFRQARAGFAATGDNGCVAMAALEIAVLCHEQGRNREVVTLLTIDVIPVLESLRLSTEALTAATLLRKAVTAGEISVTALKAARVALRCDRPFRGVAAAPAPGGEDSPPPAVSS